MKKLHILFFLAITLLVTGCITDNLFSNNKSSSLKSDQFDVLEIKDSINFDLINKGKNSSSSAVTEDLALISKDSQNKGVSISWTIDGFDSGASISTTGAVTQGWNNSEGLITATLTKNKSSEKANPIKVTILASEERKVLRSYANSFNVKTILGANIDEYNIKSSLKLITSDGAITIKWQVPDAANNAKIDTATGAVTRGTTDTAITLVAEFGKGSAKERKNITLIIKRAELVFDEKNTFAKAKSDRSIELSFAANMNSTLYYIVAEKNSLSLPPSLDVIKTGTINNNPVGTSKAELKLTANVVLTREESTLSPALEYVVYYFAVSESKEFTTPVNSFTVKTNLEPSQTLKRIYALSTKDSRPYVNEGLFVFRITDLGTKNDLLMPIQYSDYLKYSTEYEKSISCVFADSKYEYLGIKKGSAENEASVQVIIENEAESTMNDLGKINFTNWVQPESIAVKDDIAYVATSNNAKDQYGISLIDVKNKNELSFIKHYQHETTERGYYNIKVFDDYLFVVCMVNDVTNKIKAYKIKRNTISTIDSNVELELVNSIFCKSSIRNFTYRNGYLYIAEEKGLEVINFNGKELASLKYLNYLNNTGITVATINNESYLYLSKESANSNDASGVIILNLKEPGNPVEFSKIPMTSEIGDVVIGGSYAYIALNQLGLKVYDISNPKAPVEKARFDVGDCARYISIYPDETKDTMYIADGKSSLIAMENSKLVSDFWITSNLYAKDINEDIKNVIAAKDKLYLSLYNGFQIKDASENSNNYPKFSLSSNNCYDMFLADNRVIAADKYKLLLLDVSNPYSVNSLNSDSLKTDFYVKRFFDNKGELYVFGSSENNSSKIDRIAVFDVKNVNLPVKILESEISSISVDNVDDFKVSINSDNTYFYVADYENKLWTFKKVVDKDKIYFEEVKNGFTSNDKIINSTLNGNYLYVAFSEVLDKYLLTLDISKPDKPAIVSSRQLLGHAPIQMKVFENKLYMTQEENGLVVYDLSEAANPVLKDDFDWINIRKLTGQ